MSQNATVLDDLYRRFFLSDTYEFSVRGFLCQLYLVEWSTIVASIVQIPILWILRWGDSTMKLQRVLFDLYFARALYANDMVFSHSIIQMIFCIC